MVGEDDGPVALGHTPHSHMEDAMRSLDVMLLQPVPHERERERASKRERERETSEQERERERERSGLMDCRTK